MPATPTTAAATPAQEGQEPPPWEGDSTATVSPPAAQPVPDVVEDMLTMVGLGGASADKHAKEIPAQVLDAPIPATAATSLPPPVPAPAPVSSAAKPSGEHFMAWLKQGIASRRLIINDAKALVHTVSDTAYLVSPGVFQRYAQEHPQVGTLARQESQQDWQWMQKRFERLHLHRKQPNGLDIWSCEVTGPRKSRRLHGYLLEDARLLFSETPPNNPYLSLLALASPDLN